MERGDNIIEKRLIKLLLITPTPDTNPNITNYSSPNIGLYRIKGYLEAKIPQCNVTVIDTGLEYHIDWKNWDIIGVSCLHDSLHNDIEMINVARDNNPDASIFAGGIEATVNYQTILDNSKVDGVILGAGEKPFKNIIETMLNINPIYSFDWIPGLVLRNHAIPLTQEEFDEIWSYYPVDQIPLEMYWDEIIKNRNEPYIGNIRLVDISHCTRNCIFCSVSSFNSIACGQATVPVNMISPEVIVNLLTKAKQYHPELKRCYFCGDDFLWDKDRAIKILELAEPLNFTWLIQTGMLTLDEQIINRLAGLGVNHITVGLESFIPRVLTYLKKHQNPEKIWQVAEWCRQTKINLYVLIILFIPELTYTELTETYNKLRQLQEHQIDISIEPYMMSYPQTWISNHEQCISDQYKNYIGKEYKIDQIAIPQDKKVRQIFNAFREFYPRSLAKSELHHKFKGFTSTIIIDVLGQCLKYG